MQHQLVMDQEQFQDHNQGYNKQMPDPLHPVNYADVRLALSQHAENEGSGPFICTILEALRKRLTVQKSY